MFTARRRTALAAAMLAAALGLAACSSDSTTGSGSSATGTPAGTTTAGSTTAGSSSSASASGSVAVTGASGSEVFATPDPNLAAGNAAGKKVVYVPGLTGVPFYSSVSCGAKAEADRLGLQFTTQGDPTFAVDKQTAIVNALIADKPDAMMISITDPEAMIGPLQEAKDAGIQVIGIDGDLTDESVMATNIQSDNIIGGQLAADALAAAIGPDGGEVLLLNQAAGSLIGDARAKGFEDQLAAKYPNIKSLGQQYTQNAADKAASIVSAAATSNPNLKGVYTMNTNNTQGAITGIAEANRTGDVKLVGYDTSDPIVQGLRDGAIDGVVVQYPYGEGVLGVQSAVKLLNGETVERQQTTPFVIATKDNVDDPTVQQYIYKTDC
ncbi:substrate-binding domain-containing protein [Nakamurella flava]|uniref:Substrate-binding domain-containing protein n=1 Tax=Nakamurella flava TaxID=2576308 RepID=A0A4U6QGH3_9ACTN|nr:ABC transporter substrate-binding protein [Nakamurella flava]TKV59251.1 substrate-binding domain-containing protein [Nakamurella flava]